jgi:hypothetical protein
MAAQLVADHRDELALEPVDLAALGDVAEHDDRPERGSVVAQRGGRHLDRDGTAIRTQVAVLLSVGRHAVADGLGDVAAGRGEGHAGGARGVEGGVRVVPDELGGLVAQRRSGGRVDEADQPVSVDPVDAVAHRVDEELALPGELAQRPGPLLHPLFQRPAQLLVVEDEEELPAEHREQHDRPDLRGDHRLPEPDDVDEADRPADHEDGEHRGGAEHRRSFRAGLTDDTHRCGMAADGPGDEDVTGDPAEVARRA